VRRRAGISEGFAALIPELGDRRTGLTLVDLDAPPPRTGIVQAGGHGEHHFASVEWSGRTERVDARHATVQLAPGAGATVTFATVATPTSPRWSALQSAVMAPPEPRRRARVNRARAHFRRPSAYRTEPPTLDPTERPSVKQARS
jgi:hypothetical protein